VEPEDGDDTPVPGADDDVELVLVRERHDRLDSGVPGVGPAAGLPERVGCPEGPLHGVGSVSSAGRPGPQSAR
jgi:hypothetical protein